MLAAEKAEFALHIVEGLVADEGECLVADHARLGVDSGKVDDVHLGVIEVPNDVTVVAPVGVSDSALKSNVSLPPPPHILS